MDTFKLKSDFTPKGDQPNAIARLTEGIESGHPHQVLLGVTGSGKTFTVANVIAETNRPALVIAHNKTLAAQLYGEFRELFPENAVEFFVSYYDYYQPEAYLPQSDTFIDKDAMVNDDIDRLRHSATRAVLERRDVIVVASVSCIYGIGSPHDYLEMHLKIVEGLRVKRNEFLKRLIEMQYIRTDAEFRRGNFRVRGDIVEIYPPFCLDKAIRVEFFGDDIDAIHEFDPLTGAKLQKLDNISLFPNSHWITTKENLESAIVRIEGELEERIQFYRNHGAKIEASRIEERTRFDLEMLKEFGYCHGIENYSRHMSGRSKGEPSYTLMDYFPEDFITIIDESHATVPQIGGMYNGDAARKKTLIDYGFRLPSALDNRPLKFDEFEARVKRAIYVSATPAKYEIEKSEGRIIEQIIRPTGLMDPIMTVRPISGQVDDLYAEITTRALRGERTLVTTLTKKMAEDLTDHYTALGVRAKYLHSDIETLERVVILKELREGKFDALVGVNLLREGLDLPEVSLVAILDADKEGFLRSERSIIQTAGRAARNVSGEVILYADRITGSMRKAMDETDRRRRIQEDYNIKMNIVPETIKSNIKDILGSIYESDYYTVPLPADDALAEYNADDATVADLEARMKDAAKTLDFELAASLRDKVRGLRQRMLEQGIREPERKKERPKKAKREFGHKSK